LPLIFHLVDYSRLLGSWEKSPTIHHWQFEVPSVTALDV
jgi:hypothetical protein